MLVYQRVSYFHGLTFLAKSDERSSFRMLSAGVTPDQARCHFSNQSFKAWKWTADNSVRALWRCWIQSSCIAEVKPAELKKSFLSSWTSFLIFTYLFTWAMNSQQLAQELPQPRQVLPVEPGRRKLMLSWLQPLWRAETCCTESHSCGCANKSKILRFQEIDQEWSR